MLKSAKKHRGILIAGIVIALVSPMVSSGEDTGKDWYCSEPEAHSQYQKHLKLHIDHGAEVITEKLENIFSDSSLTREQKKTKAVHVLNKYLSKAKAGLGD